MNLEPFIEIAKEVEALPTYKDLIKYIDSIHNTDKFDFLVMYAKSLYLFTAGNVASVRDSSNYDPEKAEFNRQQVPVLVNALSNYTDEISLGAPTKFDYKAAGMILSALSKQQGLLTKSIKEVYRGMHSLTPSVFMRLCKPGEIYDIGNIASTSTFYEVAENFCESGTRWSLVYVLSNKTQKGLYTGKMTSGFSEEDEVIISGEIKITNFEFHPRWNAVPSYYAGPRNESITDFQELIKFINMFEVYVKKPGIHAGWMEVYGEIL